MPYTNLVLSMMMMVAALGMPRKVAITRLLLIRGAVLLVVTAPV